MKIWSNIKDNTYIIGMYFLLFIVSVLLVSTTLFFFNIKISIFTIFLSALLSIVVLFKITKIDLKAFVINISIAFLILIILTTISSYIYDFSCDGNAYHKLAIGYIKNGWNPTFYNSSDFNTINKIVPNDYQSIWIDHYAKASWLFGATIYSLTNNIESAKVITLLMMATIFCLTFDYLHKRFLKRWQSFFVALVISFNPITCAQFFTNYVDALLGLSVYTLLFFLTVISDKKYNMNKQQKWIGLFCSIILCINIKFTGTAFAGVYCIGFYILWLFKGYKDGRLKKVVINTSLFFTISVLISVCLVGYSTYIRNFLDHGNPLYPLYGNGSVDIITGQQPKLYKDMNGMEKYINQLFSKTDNILADSDRSPQYKVPFTVHRDELKSIYGPDVRISGYGVLFSGIITLSIIILTVSLAKLYRCNKEWFNICSVILAVSLIFTILFKESWWARYAPQIYIMPVFALIFLFINLNNLKIKFNKFLASLFLILIILNTGFFGLCRQDDIVQSVRLHDQMNELKRDAENKHIFINLPDESISGLIYNIKDLGITNYTYEKETETYKSINFGFFHFNYKLVN